jgi:hypothetical protein
MFHILLDTMFSTQFGNVEKVYFKNKAGRISFK